jgi:predicted ATP-binding protein involved in virulence
MPFLRQLTVERFRGAPGRIAVDFCRPKGGEGVSAIILGDNGTGKSTIVDAIELALQGT